MFIYGSGFYKKTTIFFSPVFTSYQENVVEKMRGSDYMDRLYYGSHKKALNRGTLYNDFSKCLKSKTAASTLKAKVMNVSSVQ